MKWLQKLKGVEHANPTEDLAPVDEAEAYPQHEPPPDEWTPGQLVREHGGRIEARAESRAEAKLVIKELKLKKKELQMGRRQITQEMQAVRAEYRSRVAGRHSTVGLGRGGMGRVVRAGIQGKRRAERMQSDDAVSRLEQQRNVYDSDMLELDRLILRFEQYAAGDED